MYPFVTKNPRIARSIAHGTVYQVLVNDWCLFIESYLKTFNSKPSEIRFFFVPCQLFDGDTLSDSDDHIYPKLERRGVLRFLFVPGVLVL